MSGRQGGKAKPLKKPKKGPKDLDEDDLAHKVCKTNDYNRVCLIGRLSSRTILPKVSDKTILFFKSFSGMTILENLGILTVILMLK